MILWKYGQQREKREAREAMLDTEQAVTQGYLGARVKGHAEKRQRWWTRLLRGPAKNSDKPNVAGWQELAEKFGEMGMTVQQGGERLVN